jgi:hypothetical protein
VAQASLRKDTSILTFRHVLHEERRYWRKHCRSCSRVAPRTRPSRGSGNHCIYCVAGRKPSFYHWVAEGVKYAPTLCWIIRQSDPTPELLHWPCTPAQRGGKWRMRSQF